MDSSRKRFWQKTAALVAPVALSIAVSAYAEGAWGRSGYPDWRHERHEESRAFQLGLCVGAALTQQGISMPEPQAGGGREGPSLDSSTQAALEQAIQSCRETSQGTPQPSSSPSDASTADPSSAPVPAPSADPTDIPISE